MVYVRKTVGVRLNADVRKAVEAFTLLISVQGVATTGDSFSFEFSISRNQEARFVFILHGQNCSWQLEFPCRFYESPASFNFGGQVFELKVASESKEIVCEANAPFFSGSFVRKESNSDFTGMNDMKGINDVIETQLRRAVDQLIFLDFLCIELSTDVQKPTGA